VNNEAIAGVELVS